MEDRYGNRTMSRWLIARYKRRRDIQRTRELMLDDFAEFLKSMPASALTYPATSGECLPSNSPSVYYSPEDRFDFALCEPADEIRAHGLGICLSL